MREEVGGGRESVVYSSHLTRLILGCCYTLTASVTSASSVGDLGINTQSSCTSDLKIGIPLDALPDAWCQSRRIDSLIHWQYTVT